MRRTVMILGVLLALVIRMHVPSRAQDTLDVETFTGKIVYSFNDDIYVMQANGTEPTRLTDNPAADFDPVWSPDGTQIAFRSHRDGDEEIYIMQADGSEQTNLTNHPQGDFSPAWSPDGSQLAFVGYDSDATKTETIYVVGADGLDPQVWVADPEAY